jgi:hypothetical protein
MSADVFADMLQMILAHKGAAFISTWLASHSGQPEPDAQQPHPQLQPSGKPRGRKVGAAPDEQRCVWAHTKGGRCKNSKLTDADYCKIHMEKAALIGDDAASA